MAAGVEPSEPLLPFPISRISSRVERYLLYDINVITWLRKTHHILGVLIGTLPQIPQQNVFLGLPLELMPEEAKLLSDKGIAYIVDDHRWHQEGMQSISQEQKDAYLEGLASQGQEAAKAAEKKKLESTEKAMRKLRLSSTPDRGNISSPRGLSESKEVRGEGAGAKESESFCATPGPPSGSQPSSRSTEQWSITPTTSYPPLPRPPIDPALQSPTVKASAYALFRHLHSHDYFMSPGLRFGCQFLVYPGDPLRFHSHFLAVSADWDEEIDLMDIVAGGRLGTGVKKGWLIGGTEAVNTNSRSDSPNDTMNNNVPEPRETSDIRKGSQDNRVRTFCIEWGGM